MKISAKKLYISCILFCSFLFMATGCEEAPQRPEPMERKAENEATPSSEKYVTVKEASRQAAQLEGKNTSGKIIFMLNMCDELLAVEAETEMAKIISPLWAVQQMNQKIAHLGGLRFTDGGLVYLLEQDNQQDMFQRVEDETTVLRPAWLFMSEESGAAFPGFTKDSHGTSIVIVAVDGTLYYYEHTGAY